MRIVVCFQDGADFYSEYGDEPHLWTAPFKVLDWDMDAADRARAAFFVWAKANDIQPDFDCPM